MALVFRCPKRDPMRPLPAFSQKAHPLEYC